MADRRAKGAATKGGAASKPDEAAEPPGGAPVPDDPGPGPEAEPDEPEAAEAAGGPVEAEAGGVASMAASTTAAPIDVPADMAAQVLPEHGHVDSSSNPVAANAALHNPVGSTFMRLFGEDGKDIDPADLFTAPDGPATTVMVRERVYQEFRYPGATTPTSQLLYPAGAVVPIDQAERVKASVQAVTPAG